MIIIIFNVICLIITTFIFAFFMNDFVAFLSKKAKEPSYIEFEKVSYEQFKKDYEDTFKEDIPTLDDEYIKSVYDEIQLPTRATEGSAGYDFHSTVNVHLVPRDSVKIPTGIRAKMPNNIVLQLYPRSGLGFKYRLQLNNTVGIVDSDYYNSDNEGHIFIKVTNDSNENKELDINKGDGFAQGIFNKYYVTIDDNVTAKRNGGFGSTSK